MKEHKFTLQQYAGMAGVLLLLYDNSNAQAIYSDLDPDIVLQFDNETAGVDMDNDGDYDFAFLKSSYYWTDSFYSDYEFRHVLWCGPYGFSGNEIAGTYHTNGSGGGITYRPYALDINISINDSLSFQYAGYQLLGVGFYKLVGSIWSWNYGPAFWSPGKDSSYLGIRFIDNESCRHYGWIRCSTVDSAKTLIIHDYAYESKCETGIAAGDMIGDTTVFIDELFELKVNVYSFGKTVYIQMTNFTGFKLEIWDLQGQIVIKQHLTEENSKINMELYPTGIYAIGLTKGDQKFIEKLIII